MNTAAFHLTEDLLESYALGLSSERESACAEEHLLVCPDCQKCLEDMDEFVRIMAAALAESFDDPPAARSRRIELSLMFAPAACGPSM
ncbi:MAG TPA: hypothetical protein VF146_16825 [Bryobacteraceae bacterium]